MIGKSAVLAIALALASCGSDDNGTGTGGNSGSFLQGKVDGSQFKAQVMNQSTVVAIRQGSGDNTLIQITGADASANAMNVILYGVTATGTYQVNPDTNNVLAYTTSSSASYDTGECSGATGTITVTTLTDTKVEGTFTFTGKSEENACAAKSVTEGKFRGVFANN
jgi:hypothetical protein